MNRADKDLGIIAKDAPEARRFVSFYGVDADVVVDLWGRMVLHNLIPELPLGKFCYLFWALAFMFLYPKNDTELSALFGGVDPKTIRKYVWPFINAIFELNFYVVSSSKYYCN